MPYLKSYKRDWYTDWSLIKNHIRPAIGDLHIDEVRRQHLVDLFTRHQVDHKPGSTNRVIVLVRYLFNCALKWEVPGLKKGSSRITGVSGSDLEEEVPVFAEAVGPPLDDLDLLVDVLDQARV